MSRIENTFQTLKATGRTGLVTFTMAGDPDLEKSLTVLKGLPEAGADIIEIGMPFTDPAAEGVVIQRAAKRALEAGANMHHTLDMVRSFRQNNDHTPIILMGYANPVYAYGLEQFVKNASESGVDGLIIVDLPPEEDAPLREHTEKYGLAVIRLIAPTTDKTRLSIVLDGASGFVYYVSITGVTGAAKANLQDLKPQLDMIKTKTDLPIAIGFGIKTPNDAQEMSTLGDAVVVGSSIVDKVKDIKSDSDIAPVLGFVQSLSDVLGLRS